MVSHRYCLHYFIQLMCYKLWNTDDFYGVCIVTLSHNLLVNVMHYGTSVHVDMDNLIERCVFLKCHSYVLLTVFE